MPADLSDPEYWRFRAQEVLSVAENLLGYGEIKEIMRRIAAAMGGFAMNYRAENKISASPCRHGGTRSIARRNSGDS